MAKKESPKKESSLDPAQKSGVFSRIGSALTNNAFALVKLALGICLLPFVYAATVAFLKQLGVVDASLQDWFWAGVISFLAAYLVVWEPAIIFAKGQKVLEVVFSFFQPLVKTAPFLLPIFTIIIFIGYGIASYWIVDKRLIEYALFSIGFSMALHLVFSAKTLRTKKGDALKANYIFGYSFVYLINLGLLAFCFSLIFKKFSFVNYSVATFDIGKSIFCAVFKQLFIVR